MENVAQQGAATVVRFSTPDSLRAGILWLLKALPAAGYTVGRGDAEAAAADAPFAGNGLSGVLRLAAVDGCRTDWLLAYAGAYTGPSAPAPASASASPLPFG
jgi:hypothetical protein